MSNGSSAGHVVRESIIWIVGLVAVFSSVYFSDDIVRMMAPVAQTVVEDLAAVGEPQPQPAEPAREQQRAVSGRRVFLMADQHNQFFSDARVNGRKVRVLVDTGASHVSLRHEDARRAGIFVTDSDYTHIARTANGQTRVAPITIDRIQMGSITVRNVPGLVGEPGASFVTLLGMAFLRNLKSVNISGRRMELVQ